MYNKFVISFNNISLKMYSNKCHVKEDVFNFSNIISNNLIKKKFTKLNIFDRIALIGMSLSGKTTFIKKINGIDLDEYIVYKTGNKIRDLFNINKFRSLETYYLRNIINKNNFISLGGGIVLREQNLFLLSNYLIIYLKVDTSILINRYKKNDRPLIAKKEDIINLYNNRKNLYEKYSDIIIEHSEINKLYKIIKKNKESYKDGNIKY